MERRELPEWIFALDEKELNLVKEFVLNSGSLKAMADIHGVTYPTIRLRLDRLIQRIEAAEEREEDAFERLLNNLILQEAVKPAAARALLELYSKEKSSN